MKRKGEAGETQQTKRGHGQHGRVIQGREAHEVEKIWVGLGWGEKTERIHS